MTPLQFPQGAFLDPANKLRKALTARIARRQLSWSHGVQLALEELLRSLRQQWSALESTEQETHSENREQFRALLQGLLEKTLHLSNRVRTAVINFRSGPLTAAKLVKLSAIRQNGSELMDELGIKSENGAETHPD